MIDVACVALVVCGAVPCMIGVCRGEPLDRLAGLVALGSVVTALLILMAAVFARPAYVDVALVLGVLGFAGALVFARFFARSL